MGPAVMDVEAQHHHPSPKALHLKAKPQVLGAILFRECCLLGTAGFDMSAVRISACAHNMTSRSERAL